MPLLALTREEKGGGVARGDRMSELLQTGGNWRYRKCGMTREEVDIEVCFENNRRKREVPYFTNTLFILL